MSRSKHTDPTIIRATRRLLAPNEARSVGDLSRRRQLGRQRKLAGIPPIGAEDSIRGGRVERTEKARNAPHQKDPLDEGWSRLRICVQKPRPGYYHPASKVEILRMLKNIGPVALYGLRSVDLCRARSKKSLGFGRYCTPGRIILFEQPRSPWRLAGVLKRDAARYLERAGAVVTFLREPGATLVDWPKNTLQRFMLEEVLLHELGHHLLQFHKGKRRQRIARTRDHEAFAVRFVEKKRGRRIRECC